MNRRPTFRLACFAATVVASALAAAPASAGFLVFNSNLPQATQFRDQGIVRTTYSGNYGQEETVGYVASQQRGFVYLLTSSLGQIDEVVPFRVHSGQALVNTVDGGGYQQITGVNGGAADFEFNSHRNPSRRVWGSNVARIYFHSILQEDLFIANFNPAKVTIDRYSSITGAFLQEIDLPVAGETPQDIAFGPAGQMYLATNAGVYRYDRLPAGGLGHYGAAPFNATPGIPPVKLTNDTGDITVSHTGDLFRMSSTGVSRYDGLTGAYLGEFITPADIGGDDFWAIETQQGFGPLYVMHRDPASAGGVWDISISTFDATTSGVRYRVDTLAPHFHIGPLTYLPAPEPAGATLAALGFAALVRRRRK